MTRLAAWTTFFLLTTLALARAEGDAARGEGLFNRCSGCHTVSDQNRAGPTLAGVFGRVAGTVPGARYSKALQGAGIVWDEQTLDAFLAAPRRAVPGTMMAVGMPNAGDRADMIAYLRTLTTP